MRVSGSANATVAASSEACYAVVADLGSYPEWYPGVSEAEMLESPHGPCARLRFDAGIAVLPPFSCVLTLQERRPTRLTPSVRDGPLEIGGEGWTFSALGKQTEVRLALEVQMSVPGGRLAERMIGGRGRRYLIEEPVAALAARIHALGARGRPSAGGG